MEKSQLLARLDEMKRAIDGFKQLKQAREEPLLSKQSSLVMDVSQTTSALDDDLRPRPQSPVTIMVVDEAPQPGQILHRQLLLSSRTFTDLYLANQDPVQENPFAADQGVQCELLSVEEQVQFVALHNQQLLLYREQLDLLQG